MHAEKGRPLENPCQSSALCPSSPSDGAPENVQSTAEDPRGSPESVMSEPRPSDGNGQYVNTNAS